MHTEPISQGHCQKLASFPGHSHLIAGGGNGLGTRLARSDIMKMSFAVIRVDDVRLFSYVGQGEGGGLTWRVKKHGHI